MASLAESLTALVGPGRVSTSAADLEIAARDESSLPPGRADVVVWPATTDEVAAIVRHGRETRTPVTARGAGSSLEGNPIPLCGGIVIDFSRMSNVLEIRPGDLQADVEPGVIYAELNRQLRPHGLFFPPSPGGSSDVATIGGMVSNNASGIYSAKYGGTRSHVLAVRAVTGTGDIVCLGNRCRKDSTGYHLVGLVIGSEGTLALVTEITLALAGLPAGFDRRAYTFGEDSGAARTIADLFRYGVDLAAAEFLDRATVAAVNRLRGLHLDEAPTLLLEVHGSGPGLSETTACLDSTAKEHGARHLSLPPGLDPWADVRHYATRAIMALDPDAAIVRADLATPISALPEMVAAATAIGAGHARRAFLFGHAAIGILHVLVPARRDLPEEWAAAQATRDELIAAALRLGGAVSGEHGMGLGNRGYARRAFGPALELMRGVKDVFDPSGILNPGKIWD